MKEARRNVEMWNVKVAQNSQNGEFRYRRAESTNYLNELLESQKQTETKHTQAVLDAHRQIEEQQLQLIRTIFTDLETALKLNFTSGKVYFERAFVLLLSVLKTPDDAANKERYRKALTDLEIALERGVPEQDVLEFSGDAKRKLGNFKGALSDYRKINLAKQDPDLKAMWYGRIARTQFKLKQYGEAIASATRALELCAKITHEFAYMRGRIKQSALQTWAESHFALGNWAKAHHALDLYLAIRPDKPQMWMLRARTNFEMKCYNSAVQDCLEVLKLDPLYPDAEQLKDRVNHARQAYLAPPVVPVPPLPLDEATLLQVCAIPPAYSPRMFSPGNAGSAPPQGKVLPEPPQEKKGMCLIM